MVELFPTSSSDVAYNKISGMLAALGDPFTQIISPKEYQSFRIKSYGNLQGLFINLEPKIGHLCCMFFSCIEGGPTARVGIREGDELIEIDGQRSSSSSNEKRCSTFICFRLSI